MKFKPVKERKKRKNISLKRRLHDGRDSSTFVYNINNLKYFLEIDNIILEQEFDYGNRTKKILEIR